MKELTIVKHGQNGIAILVDGLQMWSGTITEWSKAIANPQLRSGRPPSGSPDGGSQQFGEPARLAA